MVSITSYLYIFRFDIFYLEYANQVQMSMLEQFMQRLTKKIKNHTKDIYGLSLRPLLLSMEKDSKPSLHQQEALQSGPLQASPDPLLHTV